MYEQGEMHMQKNSWSNKKLIALVLVAVLLLGGAGFAVKLIADRNQSQQADLPEVVIVDETGSTQESKVQEDPKPTASAVPAGEFAQPVEQPVAATEKPVQNKALVKNVDDGKNTSGSGNSHVNPESSDNGPSGSSDSNKEEYTVTFQTMGGSNIASRKVEKGTKISSLPTPYRDGYIFVNWYYNAGKTQGVASADTVDRDLTLYADYTSQSPIDNIDGVSITSSLEEKKDFQIKVVSDDTSLSAETVKAAITAKNLTDPAADGRDIIEVTGGNGTFLIKGRTPITDDGSIEAEKGFAAGATYQILLADARLRFADQPETVREYNFTTAKDQVLNAALNADITYIPVQDLKNITNNGVSVSTLSIALYQADKSGVLGPADLTEGTFEYSGDQNLAIGDIISVYAGKRPDLRTLDTPKEENGDVAYIEITAKNGNLYSYKNAAPEDVIFEPDMLPVPADADLDGDADNNSITVSNDVLDYSGDIYANIELDSQTTVDKGDYLMFYTGTFGMESENDAAQLSGYAEVKSVTENTDGTTTITYEVVNWEEVQQTMAIYAKQRMSGEEMIDGVDTQALEAQIEQQARESGFAEEAAQYLGSLALATDNFTRLSDNMNLEDYKVTLSDGSPVSPEDLQLMASGVSAECELESLKASIGTHPTHFNDVADSVARDNGLTIDLEVCAKITIGKTGSDNQLVITVTGTFSEEVGMDLSVSSKAVWKVWGIFPYIAEYRVTANIDVLNYTGISVNATMVTKEEENGLDIAEQIKQMLEETVQGEGEDKEEASNNLVKRYSEMLQTDSDWIRVIEQNIVDEEKQLPPAFPIIAVNIEVNFVVEMDACVSVGFDFEYLTGKRYTYTVDVFAGKVYNDTVTLLEEKYEFDFYAMGRLGVKAGLEFRFKVGLFSTDLDSVGFRAEAGAYTKLWGYFYYELKYTASSGRSQQHSGALLVDVGAYLELGLTADALGGKYSTELSLYDNEWSLWTAGKQDNILDFTTEQKDMPEIKLKQQVRQMTIPDSVFSMHYLDLKDGDEKDAVYNEYYDESARDSSSNRRNFDIRMTNDKFTYDPQTNTISVNPEAGDKKLEGEMIITWIQYPLAFSSKPIQRRISLYWDNLRDGYVIVPYTNGGSYIDIINAKYEAKVIRPADPVKAGYNFAGWFSDEELTVPYVFPERMPAADTNIYAKWEARTDTAYRVEHYKEQLSSGTYEVFESEDLKGTTEEYGTADVKTYIGYKSPAKQEVKILADGSAVLRYYYPLEWHTVTFDPGEVGGEKVSYDLKYGGKVIAPQMAVKGYTFLGWSLDGENKVSVKQTMGTEDVTYIALWKQNPDTAYRVEYYLQDTNGNYKLDQFVEREAYTGTMLKAEELENIVLKDGKTAAQLYAAAGGTAFDRMTVRGENLSEVAVSGDGSTVIKIYYKREIHTVTYDFGYDGKSSSKEYYYGTEFTLPDQIKRTGYTFKGWSLNGTPIVEQNRTMTAEDVTYTAMWTPNSYTVVFDKSAGSSNGSMKSMQFVYDKPQNLTENGYTRANYDFAGWTLKKGAKPTWKNAEEVQNLTAEANGTVTLYAVWTPAVYQITYQGVEDGGRYNPTSYTVESETITLSAPVRTGYVFAGWYTNESLSGEPVTALKQGSYGDRTYYAKWNPATDTPYRVEHYQQNVEGGYTLTESESLTGTTDSSVTPGVKEYNGFQTPETQTVLIHADGSTVVRYEYNRKEYTLTLDAGEGSLGSAESEIKRIYGASIALPVPTRTGYGFEGWYVGDNKFTDSTMPAENMKLTAKWAAGKYGYTVNHYKENLNGEYVLAQTVTGTADVDSTVTAKLMEYEGFTTKAETQEQEIKIRTDATKNVVDYYYLRNRYQLSWDLAGGTAEEGYTAGEVAYEVPITAPVPVKTGYSYTWNEVPAAQMPAAAISYTAIWTPKEYTVTYVTNGGVSEKEITPKTVTYDAAYGDLPVLTKKGYTFDGWFVKGENGTETQVTADTVVNIADHHSLYAHFTPVRYTITYHGTDNARNTNPTQYDVETGTIVLKDAVKKGYTFEGWYTTEDYAGRKVTDVAVEQAADLNLYAKWQENSYTVIFHSNNGLPETEQNFTYTEEKQLEKNPFTKAGYSFAGWAKTAGSSTSVYEDGAKVSGLTADADGEIHLYAVWKLITYRINYRNMDGAENAAGNPTQFTIENNQITLENPTKTGYTFDGWYTDSGFQKKVSGAITLNGCYDWNFYAKWVANPYTITFDSCLGDTVPTETKLMTYDVSANLTLLSEMRNFVKPGYKFLGWAEEKDGAVVYADGQTVKNLQPYGNITLYAVWKQNIYHITYDLGAGGTSHSNPSDYNIDGNDVKLSAPEAKDGYEFLGWYQGNTKVTEIVKGTEEDFDLTAKWAHGGYFTLSFAKEEAKELADGSMGKTVTFKISRMIPEGAEATANPIYVYYRTVNGTAYGSTVDIDVAQDKYHFKHCGGEDAYVIFGAKDTEMTFTVEEWGAETTADAAAAAQTNNTDRYYNVELYKVVNTVGKSKGFLSEIHSQKRVFPAASQFLVQNSLYNTWYGYTIATGDPEISNKHYKDGRTFTFNSLAQVLQGTSMDAMKKAYLQKTVNKAAFYMTIDIKEVADGYFWTRLSAGGASFGEYVMDTGNKDWKKDVALPFTGDKQVDTKFVWSKGGYNASNVSAGSPTYALIGVNDQVLAETAADGSGSNKWKWGTTDLHYRAIDARCPQQVGIANMALTQYKAGDQISITVIYDEVIASGVFLELSEIDGLPVKDVTYVAGEGTNALTFTATVTKDFEVTPDLNNKLQNVKPMTGKVMDIWRNQN